MGNKRFLIFSICVLLGAGFAATSLLSYGASKTAIREGIVATELPLTSDNIYSEIQKDLIRPIFIASMMASDTFLRDWVVNGEYDLPKITRYLAEIQQRFGTFTSFFVSDRSRMYYHPGGILKQVREDEHRDVWFFRVRAMTDPYEINVDIDMAHQDALTIFINYRVLDFQGRFLGATGVGLNVESVHSLITGYQERYGRNVAFVNPEGRIMLSSNPAWRQGQRLQDTTGVADLAEDILRSGRISYQFHAQGAEHLLNVRFLPELNWFLLVEKAEDAALAGVRRTLYVNLGLCAGVTALVLLAVGLTLNRFQSRLEEMATTDKLTGLANRQAFDILLNQAMREARRSGAPLSVLLADIDGFKAINDKYGHLAGDAVIRQVAETIHGCLRDSDILCRWGGEEYLAALRGCGQEQALLLAEKVCDRVRALRPNVDGEGLSLSISAGVATLLPDDGPDNLLGRADTALYAAKGSGRNRSCSA
jgi:diguanylate cyclase (GGDEF)-like protein